MYFRNAGRDPDYLAHDDCRCEVVLMSGLPGSGKDHWIREHLCDLPVVSLDALREELEVSPAGPQGVVVAQARERARVHLRAGRSFVWNATNLNRALREECIGLFAAYHARVKIAYVEARESVLFDQNERRISSVPESVMERMLDRWEVPDLTEAQQVDFTALVTEE